MEQVATKGVIALRVARRGTDVTFMCRSDTELYGTEPYERTVTRIESLHIPFIGRILLHTGGPVGTLEMFLKQLRVETEGDNVNPATLPRALP